MKKKYSLFLMLFVFSYVSSIGQGTDVRSNAIGFNKTISYGINANKTVCNSIWTQLDNPLDPFENGWPSHPGANAVADDIIIPASDCWNINQVMFNQFCLTVPVTVDITFMDDATGPGGISNGGTAQSLSVPFTAVVVGNRYGYDVYEITATLPTPINMCAGASATTYWLSCQAVDAGGDGYWQAQSTTLHGGSDSYNSSIIAGPWNLNSPWNTVFTLGITGPDVTAPVEDVATLADATGQCSVAAITAPTATDNCAGSVTGTTTTTFPIISNTTITWTYDDGNGNTSTQTQDVVITDSTAPVEDVATLTDATDQCSVAAITAPTATDNCAGTVTGTTTTTFPITAQGTTTITWTYVDGNGNSSTQTQDVVITDSTAPVEDVATLTDATGQCSVTPTAPTATDNCAGTVTGTTTTTFPITAQGTTTITWTYVDGNGNSSTQTQDVVITDVTAPVEDVATLTDATDQCAVAAITAPTATDNCAGTVTGTTTTTFPITTQGTTTITWTYVDGNGNSSTQTQDVVITDVTAPVEDVATLTDATDQCSVAAITAPTATDNCAGTVTGTTTTTFPITAQGTTTITWTYVDGNGNSSTQTQDVVITDVTAPVEDVATLVDSVSECDVTPIAPTATDNCAGAVTGTTTTTFPITASGTTTITWTYVDGNGNSSTQTQDVVITPIDTTVTLSGDTMTANATGYTYQWVDCDNGNTPVAGATNQSFIPTTGGNYAVEISNGDCMYMSACDLSTVSVNENNILSTINIYPNPANDILNVSMANGDSPVNFTLLSIDGKVVYQLNNITDKTVAIDISNNSKGLYFLKVATIDDYKVYKVIKQ